jgi:hypothetical protein
MTCLFWFEKTSKLQAIEDNQNPVPSLVAEAVPTVGFQKWVATILSTTQVSQNVILLALLFIYRLKKFNSGVKGKKGSEFRLMTVALMLGNKCECSYRVDRPSLDVSDWTTLLTHLQFSTITPTPIRRGLRYRALQCMRFTSWRLSS